MKVAIRDRDAQSIAGSANGSPQPIDPSEGHRLPRFPFGVLPEAPPEATIAECPWHAMPSKTPGIRMRTMTTLILLATLPSLVLPGNLVFCQSSGEFSVKLDSSTGAACQLCRSSAGCAEEADTALPSCCKKRRLVEHPGTGLRPQEADCTCCLLLSGDAEPTGFPPLEVRGTKAPALAFLAGADVPAVLIEAAPLPRPLAEPPSGPPLAPNHRPLRI